MTLSAGKEIGFCPWVSVGITADSCMDGACSSTIPTSDTSSSRTFKNKIIMQIIKVRQGNIREEETRKSRRQS